MIPTAFTTQPDGTPLHDLFVKRVAIRFSANLRKAIGEGNLETVIRRNTEEPEGSGVCHSHDFCDANIFMSAAFCEMLGADDPDDDGFLLVMGSKSMVRAWNDAWAMARRYDFYLHVGRCDHRLQDHASGFVRECAMCGTIIEG